MLCRAVPGEKWGCEASWGVVVGQALAAWVCCYNLQPFAVWRAEPLMLFGPHRRGGMGELGVCRCKDMLAGSAAEVHVSFTLKGHLNALCVCETLSRHSAPPGDIQLLLGTAGQGDSSSSHHPQAALRCSWPHETEGCHYPPPRRQGRGAGWASSWLGQLHPW